MITRITLFLSIVIGSTIACNRPLPESTFDEEGTIFYLLRHAEKELEGEDPNLNPIGKARAQLIKSMFSNTPISAIYTTPFLRNMETVRPLAEARNIPIFTYDPKDTPALIDAIFDQHKYGQVLVVGHSNTIPGMVNTLIWEDRLPDLEEEEYQRLFIVTGFRYKKGSYTEISFNP